MAIFQGKDLIEILGAMLASASTVAIAGSDWKMLGYIPVAQALGIVSGGGIEGVGNRRRIRRLRYLPPAAGELQPRIDPTEFRTFGGVKSGGVLPWQFSSGMATAASKRATTRMRTRKRAKAHKAYPLPIPPKMEVKQNAD
jgi:hypothetical protein